MAFISCSAWITYCGPFQIPAACVVAQRLSIPREEHRPVTPPARELILNYLRAQTIKRCFSRDGSLLFCSTRDDIRIFNWQAVFESVNGVPEPKPVVEFERESLDGPAFDVETVLEYEGPVRQHIGAIRSTSLESGLRTMLIKVPGDLPILRSDSPPHDHTKPPAGE